MEEPRTIPLSKGYHATADAEVYPHLAPLSWHAHFGHGGQVYARHTERRRSIYMHRLVLQVAGIRIPRGMSVTHCNGNTLDNRLANLALIPRGQHERKNTNRYKGVYYVKGRTLRRPWKAAVAVGGKSIHLGYHATAEEAARAYNEAALAHFGPHATLNRVR